MNPNTQGVKDVVINTLSFPDMLMRIFQDFFFLMQQVICDQSLSTEQRLLYGTGLLFGFTIVSFVSVWFVVFVLRWVFRGIACLFGAIAQSLSDPASLPYIVTLSIVRATPWYFNVLLIILLFCGCLAVIGGDFWADSFKYVLGATVGSLIGVVKKKEESDFDQGLFDAARSLSMHATEARRQSVGSDSVP